MARTIISRRRIGRRSLSLVTMIVAITACQDSLTGPEMQRAASPLDSPEIGMRLGADYAEQGDVLSLALQTDGAVDVRARLTWDPNRFELIQDDLDAEWIGRDLDRGELFLEVGGAQGSVELRFRALTTGATAGFGVEAQRLHGGGDDFDPDAVII